MNKFETFVNKFRNLTELLSSKGHVMSKVYADTFDWLTILNFIVWGDFAVLLDN